MLLAGIFAPSVSAAVYSNSSDQTPVQDSSEDFDLSQMDTWTPEQITAFLNGTAPATYFSNQQIFDALKAQGVDAQKVLSPSDYQQAIFQDGLRQGGTYIKKLSNGIRIYLNSAIVKLLAAAGAIFIAVKLSPILVGLLGAAGIALTQTQMQSVIAGVSYVWGTISTSRGIWIEIRAKFVYMKGILKTVEAFPVVKVGQQ